VSEPVFLDTSALYALLDGDDASHPAVNEAWRGVLTSEAPLHTSSYVLVELEALLQRRLGLAAVDALTTFVLPWVSISWVDERIYEQATAALLGAGKRDVSLVDHASFIIMRRLGVRTALTLDGHFAQQGFSVVPQVEVGPADAGNVRSV
jgi:predicted nucleic acid-binding protein